MSRLVEYRATVPTKSIGGANGLYGVPGAAQPAATRAGAARHLELVPEPAAIPPAEQRFQTLARQWKEATQYTSSITDMATHPAYQQIIGMGEKALPFLLEELRQEPDHWFWALKAITGEDPVAPTDRGKLRLMANAWLVWAASHGY